MPRAKPGQRFGGRSKGTPNKVTALAKDIISGVAEKLGGLERLAKWAQEDPKNESVFWANIFTKTLPHEVTGGLEIKTPAIVELPPKKARE